MSQWKHQNIERSIGDQQSIDGIKMGFLKIFLERTLREIAHLLPKNERKDAKNRTIQGLADDVLVHVCHTLGANEKPEFDWGKFIEGSEPVKEFLKRHKDLIERHVQHKESPKK